MKYTLPEYTCLVIKTDIRQTDDNVTVTDTDIHLASVTKQLREFENSVLFFFRSNF